MNIKPRDANMDLMRITAMLLVMFYHLNYYNIALEKAAVTSYSQMQIFGYSLMKCVSMVCVNMFILISGWYGINANIKGFCKLAFQIWFFSIPIYLIFCLACDDLDFSFNLFCHLLVFGGYWFLPAYLFLYICSPVLNAFVLKASQKTFLAFLIVYFSFLFLYGWLEREPYFDKGCSPLVFFGLYMIARYIRLYRPKWTQFKTSVLVACYLSILVLTACLCFLITIRYSQQRAEMLMENSSPLNIALSLLLLVLFSRINIHSKVINKIGISCLAVYLLHASPFFYEKIYYPLGCRVFHVEPALLSIILLSTMIGVIFFASILIDLVRIAVWNKAETIITAFLSNKE